jgi:hypothetical protein
MQSSEELCEGGKLRDPVITLRRHRKNLVGHPVVRRSAFQAAPDSGCSGRPFFEHVSKTF